MDKSLRNTSSSTVDKLKKQRIPTPSRKNSLKFVHPSAVSEEGKMGRDRKVLKRKIVTKNIGNNKVSSKRAKRSLNNKDSPPSNSLRNVTVPKQSFIVINEDDFVSRDSAHLSENDSYKSVSRDSAYLSQNDSDKPDSRDTVHSTQNGSDKPDSRDTVHSTQNGSDKPDSRDTVHSTQNGSGKPIAAEKPYVCSYCSFQTCFYNSFANHQRRHNIRQPWACSQCNYSSTTKYCLQRHVKLVHEKPQNICCNECDFRCSRQKQLKNHMLVHSRKNYFQCNVCDYKHIKQAKVKRHMVMHLDNNFDLMCTMCGYRGVKPEHLSRHMEKRHSFEHSFEKSFGIPENVKENFDINSLKDNKSYLIKSFNKSIIEKQPVVLLRRCDEDIIGTDNSAVNMEVIHEQILQDNFLEVAKCGDSEEIINPELLNCSQQDDQSLVVMKSALITKKKNIITSIVKVVDNDQITQTQLNTQKSESTKENIMRQLKFKRGVLIPEPESKPVVINEIVFNKIQNLKPPEVYQCKECGFVSKWLDRYETHMQLHSKECFSCDKCDFITNFQYSLGRHKRMKHSQIKDFKCEKCDHSCSTPQNLDHHMRCHEKARRFKCNQCDVQCKTALSLKRHKSTHNGEKPFACDICEFRTRHKNSLESHRFSHTGKSKYICEICNCKFYAKDGLKKHMELHSPSN